MVHGIVLITYNTTSSSQSATNTNNGKEKSDPNSAAQFISILLHSNEKGSQNQPKWTRRSDIKAHAMACMTQKTAD